MALKQHTKGFTDDLNELTEQQLRSFLEEELDSEDVNYELIKIITGVLAAKTDEKPIDAEAAYQQFLSQYADTDPLNEELEQEAGALEMNASIPETEEENAPGHFGKVVHFSRLAKLGILVAAIVALFLAISAVASAMGFSIWRANVMWDQENMGVSSVSGESINVEDPIFDLRSALSNENITNPVVPNYFPEGYEPLEFNSSSSSETKFFDLILSNGSKSIIFSYSIPTSAYNSFFPKDDEDPELYLAHGIEHYITSNEGRYRAVWDNGGIVCTISGVEDKEELLLMIDSIYEG